MGLLVPLFFAYSGLNTQIGLLNTGALWIVAILVVFVPLSVNRYRRST